VVRQPALTYGIGIASAIPPLALLLFLGGPPVVRQLGLWLLIAPAIGAVATVVALIHVYRGRALARSDVAWVLLLGPFFFVALPAFWYRKIYRRHDARPNARLQSPRRARG
jgi:glycerol-3-phosphate acyltransferase PlsY